MPSIGGIRQTLGGEIPPTRRKSHRSVFGSFPGLARPLNSNGHDPADNRTGDKRENLKCQPVAAFSRTLVAIAAALAMSTVTVGAAVGPAQAVANPVDRSAQASMPELEVLEAKVPVRTPAMVQSRQLRAAGIRLAPVAAWLNGPVFSRARDIFAANMTELLDRAEDPARMIRMIILEMEETLVEVRAARRALDRRHQGNAPRAEPARRPPGQLDRQGRAGAVEGPRGPRQGRR